MADMVGSLTTVVELALKIKDAVDAVSQNRTDCAHIKHRVERVRHTLSLCEGNAELMESPAVRDAVEALAEVLEETLELVTGCQEETNAACLCCRAGNLSKQLGMVDRGISDGNAEATFAILVYHISKQTADGARPAMTIEERIEHILSGANPNTCILTSSEETQSFYRPSKKAKLPRFLKRTLHFLETPTLGYRLVSAKNSIDICYGENDEEDHGDNGSLLQEIASVALAIRTKMETVRRNKDECVQIDKLASRASVVLLQLEDREMTKNMVVRDALKSLLSTFRHARELVEACHRRSVVVLCSPGKQSSVLRGVLDEMMLGLDGLIAALM